MANKVYVVMYKCNNEKRNSTNAWINSVHSTFESAKKVIEEVRDEYRANKDITILGENWSNDEYAYYNVRYVENYYVKCYNDNEYIELVEYNVEEHEMAD